MSKKHIAASLFATYRLVLAEYSKERLPLIPLSQPDYDFPLVCMADRELPVWLGETVAVRQPSIYISLIGSMWVAFPYKGSIFTVGPLRLSKVDSVQIEKACAADGRLPTGEVVAAYKGLPMLPYLEVMRAFPQTYTTYLTKPLIMNLLTQNTKAAMQCL